MPLNPAYFDVWYNLLFALAVALVFTLHEMGHYLAAVLSGVNVESVIIGFGREIWSRTGSNRTHWSVRILPVCGRVHLRAASVLEAVEGPVVATFMQQVWWKRFIIVLAGPLANLVTAFVALALFYTAAGLLGKPPLVAGVEVGSPAAIAGIRPGDRLVAVNGRPTLRFDEASRETAKGQPVALTFCRDGKTFDVRLTPVMASYRDAGGFSRRRGFAGMLMAAKPQLLSAVYRVNGVDVKGNVDKARMLIVQALGKEATITLPTDDQAVHDYLVRIPAGPNENLRGADAGLVRAVNFSSYPGSIYVATDTLGALREAGYEYGRLTEGLATILSHLPPVDKGLIEPETPVDLVAAPVRGELFRFVHVVASLSICIALINLVPLPGLDGGFLLATMVEGVVGRHRALIVRPYVMRLTILTMVVLWLLANLPRVQAVMP